MIRESSGALILECRYFNGKESQVHTDVEAQVMQGRRPELINRDRNLQCDNTDLKEGILLTTQNLRATSSFET